MQQNPIFNLDLIHKYDKAGPRYTSYPTAVQFHNEFTETDYRQYAKNSNETKDLKPLSLYFHIPFCNTVCFYCACNKIATKDHSLAVPYLSHLTREIEIQSQLFDSKRPVTQLHFGGGTPTFLHPVQMRELMKTIGQHFQLLDDDKGEYSIEIDPRDVSADTIAMLREIGFNRLSMGVQDLESKVQKAVNRIQTEEETFAILDAARKQDFNSINLDLMYGLPHQTVESFIRTLDKVIAVKPDRLSVFNYAHLPTLFKPQVRINTPDLPHPSEKLAILQESIHRLIQAGYVYIGMDHFALPDDELTIAQGNGSLYRNFQGYSTHADCDLVAMGITSISQVGDSYSQNIKTLEEYYTEIDAGHIPIFRGVALNADDKLRRTLITQLICHFQLDIQTIEKEYDIDFKEYFKVELTELDVLQADGLISYDSEKIEVLPAGRLLIRNICMVFDSYLRKGKGKRFSKVI